MFNNADNNENIIIANENGAVELYFNNSKKFETVTAGISVTGQVSSDTLHIADGTTGIQVGDSSDLKIYHDSSNGNSHIKESGSGSLVINADDLYLQNAAGTENLAVFTEDGAVELYHNNSKKLSTDSNGVKINSSSLYIDSDNEFIAVGAGDDLKISHDGTDNKINSVNGNLILQHSNATKAMVTGGDFRPATGNNIDLGVSSAKWQNVHAVRYYGDGSNLTGISGGKILQVVSTTRTDTFSESGINECEHSGAAISVTITPSSSSSKILITASLSIGLNTDNDISFAFFKGGSILSGAIGDTASNRLRTGFAGKCEATSHVEGISGTFLDSPNTTSALTYDCRLSHGHNGGNRTMYLNRSHSDTDADQDSRYVSTITVMEVAA